MQMNNFFFVTLRFITTVVQGGALQLLQLTALFATCCAVLLTLIAFDRREGLQR